MRYKLIIVDDEPHARRYLTELIKSDSEIELLDQFGNGKNALQFLARNAVDIILLDIEMPKMNGLELVQQLKYSERTEVIFTTAYNQYAIKAFEVSAIDYLLKPFDQSRLLQALEKAKKQLELKSKVSLHSKVQRLFQEFENESNSTSEFIIKHKGLHLTLKPDQIIAIEANGVYVNFVSEKKIHLYRKSLSEISALLNQDFLRIHRSTIINFSFLTAWKYLNNSTFELQMSNGVKYTSSRGYLEQVRKRLEEKSHE